MRVIGLVALALLGCTEKRPPALRVAAASDLIDVFTVLGARFEAQEKVKVEFSFGSSGLLARQLTEGAPFDVFAPASQAYAAQTVSSGACLGDTRRPLARGRLVIWPTSVSLQELGTRTGRVALANPEHAPYGRAAKEALQHAGVWEAVAPRVVYAENVRQALALADSGDVEASVVARSNVIKRRPPDTALVDASLHEPIEQVVLRCTRGQEPEAAARFIELLGDAASKQLLTEYGFEP